jgi:N-acetylneuraminate synthase
VTENKAITINQQKIGRDYKPYIVAEISANHNGKIDIALDHIEAAAKSGADAVKIQSYTPDTMTINSNKADFQINKGLWRGYNLYDLYKQAYTPFEWHKTLFEKADDVGITLFSTPFDESAVDLLESCNAPAYKIASFELIDLPLIALVAQTGKPLVLSTGMANLEEIEEAIHTAKSNGCKELIVLHCISSYPAPLDQCNLLTMMDLQKRFNVEVGLSDHTVSNTAAITAVALGAVFIEKHFITDRTLGGPDASFSIEPSQLQALVVETQKAYETLGAATYERQQCEQENIKFRRSLYFTKALEAGEVITPEKLRRIRPGYGLAPKHYENILNKTVNKKIEAGTAVSWDLIDEDQ